MILSIAFLGTCPQGILFAHDDLLTALGKVEDTEEEFGTFFHAFADHIVGLEFKVIVIGDGRYRFGLRARRDLCLAHLRDILLIWLLTVGRRIAHHRLV